MRVIIHKRQGTGSHCKRCACNPAFHDTFVLVRARYRRRQEIVGALSINRQDLGEIPKVTLQGCIEVDVKFFFAELVDTVNFSFLMNSSFQVS